MKKPNPEHPIIKLSLSLWREQMAADDLSEEDKALQQTKDELRKQHNTELAGKVKNILFTSLTEKQLKIFSSFVETNSFRETARELNIQQSYVHKIVMKARQVVVEGLQQVNASV